MSKGRHINKSKFPLQSTAVMSLPPAVPPARCRVTHDVPYTLRCVLEVHPVHADRGVMAHKDKKGNWWETPIEN
jgi:hypothetical protein